MRLMLGTIQDGVLHPALLVETIGLRMRHKFRFDVVNGAWRGAFVEGEVFVEGDSESAGNYEVMCRDQAKLSGDYNEVFSRFR